MIGRELLENDTTRHGKFGKVFRNSFNRDCSDSLGTTRKGHDTS